MEARFIVWLRPWGKLDCARAVYGGCAALIHPTKPVVSVGWISLQAHPPKSPGDWMKAHRNCIRFRSLALNPTTIEYRYWAPQGGNGVGSGWVKSNSTWNSRPFGRDSS